MIRKGIFKVIVACLLVVIAWKSMSIFGYYQAYHQADQAYEQLAACKAEKPETQFVSWEALQKINPDVVGWLVLPGTRINYPVVQGKDNTYYLDHLFDGTENLAGCLFLDSENTPDFLCQNSVIYGHYMKNKSMFHDLSYYKDAAWWEEHPYFWLILPDRTEKLEVFSAYVTDVTEDAWKLDFSSQEEYEDWIGRLKDRSMFQPETDVGIPERVITCSTCSYEFENARLVIHLAV